MRILIAYGTAQGQTRKIAEFLAGRFREQAHNVETCELTARQKAPVLSGFDAFVVASPVRMGAYMRPVVRFARTHQPLLQSKPSAFISVSMSAVSDNQVLAQTELAKRVTAFSQKTGWTPDFVHQAAGALAYTKYDFITRWVMGRISRKEGHDLDITQDHEFTDWQALAAFADAFTAAAQRTAPSAVPDLKAA